MSENHDGPRARPLIVSLQTSAVEGFDAKRREQISRHRHRGKPFRIAAAGERHRVGHDAANCREPHRCPPPVVEIRIGHGQVRETRAHLGVAAPDVDEPVGVGVWQRHDQHAIQEREHHRGRRALEREDAGRRQREQRHPPGRAG
jgi:hypothetical protein